MFEAPGVVPSVDRPREHPDSLAVGTPVHPYRALPEPCIEATPRRWGLQRVAAPIALVCGGILAVLSVAAAVVPMSKPRSTHAPRPRTIPITVQAFDVHAPDACMQASGRKDGSFSWVSCACGSSDGCVPVE
jgi:hypothetical protein